MHDGVWYYGTYCLDELGRTAADGSPLNWDILGPFVGFRISRDGGETWEETPHSPARPLFGESGKNGGKIRIGTPHVVDFGRTCSIRQTGKPILSDMAQTARMPNWPGSVAIKRICAGRSRRLKQ